METRKANLKKILWQSEEYKRDNVGFVILLTDQGVFKGETPFPLCVGIHYEFQGEDKVHAKYGKSFHFDIVGLPFVPKDIHPNTLARFLAQNNGISEAENLKFVLGRGVSDVLHRLENHLILLPHITGPVIGHWSSAREGLSVREMLIRVGVPAQVATKIVSVGSAVQMRYIFERAKMDLDIVSLYHQLVKLPQVSFDTADKILRDRYAITLDNPARLYAGFCIQGDLRLRDDGDVWTYAKGIMKRVAKDLSVSVALLEKVVEQSIKNDPSSPIVLRQSKEGLIIESKAVQQSEYFIAEKLLS